MDTNSKERLAWLRTRSYAAYCFGDDTATLTATTTTTIIDHQGSQQRPQTSY